MKSNYPTNPSIPLSLCPTDVHPYCPRKSNGSYSVKSGYIVLFNLLHPQLDELDSSPWHQFWFTSLQSSVHVDPCCPLCLSSPEFSLPFSFNCPCAVSFWSLSSFSNCPGLVIICILISHILINKMHWGFRNSANEKIGRINFLLNSCFSGSFELQSGWLEAQNASSFADSLLLPST
ncbi:hypothetical protein M5689_004597 [Euphorbia peplus]|nr:hypothetical protein M5689_004597 [Euphorbia peplus]